MQPSHPIIRRAIRRAVVVGLGSVIALSAASTASASRGHDGQVYAISNDPASNALLVFDRDRDGSLSAPTSIPTGGTGTGSGLGSQGAVTVSDDGRVVLAVNPGSDQVSLFVERGNELVLVDTESSGGDMPTSVTLDGRDVYVLNAGADNNISGFRIGRDGLDPVAGSTQSLSQLDAGGAQVSFTPDGRSLVVTERFTNRIDTFRVRRGVAEPAVVSDSTGPTPFGFDFSRRGELIVSNANAGVADGSSVSSYAVDRDGSVDPIDGPDATTESAACWLVVAGRYAYAANAGSDTVTGYAVARDGSLDILQPDGVSANVGDGPLDLDVSDDGRYLYQLNGAGDSIGIFSIGDDGELIPLDVVTGLPATATGLAVS